ncbi:hypothetical protein Tco_0681236 [Tanacetum coccineum]|uniref:RNA polymerase alpha subunit n=1 Tax=Tanacetum coccineum TaxID=301880 RepID=A0ABQ4XPD9_9ASTR
MKLELTREREYPEESIKEFFVKHAQEIITTVQSAVKIVTQQHEAGSSEKSKEQAAFTPYWKIPIIDDDDDEYAIQYREYLENSSNAITPELSTEEPDNSLSMGDEHLDTIPETESNEVIKSSVKDLIQIPRESEDTSIIYSLKIDSLLEEFADIRLVEQLLYNSSHILLNDHFEISPFNDDYTSSNDDFYEDIDYVEASLPDSELVSLEEVKDDLLREKLLNINLLIAKIESLNNNSTLDCVFKSPIPVKDSDSFFEKSNTSLSYLDNSLPEFKTFSDHTEETSSGSTTTHADNSLPKYDPFHFEIESNQGELTRVVVEDISDNLTRELYFMCHCFTPSLPTLEDRHYLFSHKIAWILKTLVLVVLSIVHSIFYPSHVYIWESDIIDLID